MGLFSRKPPKAKVVHVAGTQKASDELIYRNMETATRDALAKMGKSKREIDAYIADSRKAGAR